MSNVQQTLDERGTRYGDFTDHAAIAQSLQDSMRLTRPDGWGKLNDVQRQALTVIADKIARVLSGDPNYADSWHDIQGYARLVEERLSHGEVGPLSRPAWPADKSYRWMVQTENGNWFVLSERPSLRYNLWVPETGFFRHIATSAVIGDWRKSLIERGADE